MSRTRLAAAAGVAALTLGATAAVAEDPSDTQTVTITVETAPRTIEVDGTVGFSVDAGQENFVAITNSVSTLKYTNPTGNSSASISVSRDDQDLDGLTLTAIAAEPDLGEGSPQEIDPFEGTDGAAQDFMSAIDSGTDLSGGVSVTFTLAGDSGDARNFDTVFTFTIGDDGND